MKWLWLDDKRDSIGDLRKIFKDAGINVTKEFESPITLTKYLINNSRTKGFLSSHGLILDCLLYKHNYIICYPGLLNGIKKPLPFKTQKDGHDAGILYYEKVILGLDIPEVDPVWIPYPPVLFLSVIDIDFQENEQRIGGIKRVWMENHNTTIDKAKVEWLSKWDMTLDVIIEIFKKWGEL